MNDITVYSQGIVFRALNPEADRPLGEQQFQTSTKSRNGKVKYRLFVRRSSVIRRLRQLNVSIDDIRSLDNFNGNSSVTVVVQGNTGFSREGGTASLRQYH
jgi:hypothetical protein